MGNYYLKEKNGEKEDETGLNLSFTFLMFRWFFVNKGQKKSLILKREKGRKRKNG